MWMIYRKRKTYIRGRRGIVGSRGEMIALSPTILFESNILADGPLQHSNYVHKNSTKQNESPIKLKKRICKIQEYIIYLSSLSQAKATTLETPNSLKMANLAFFLCGGHTAAP